MGEMMRILIRGITSRFKDLPSALRRLHPPLLQGIGIYTREKVKSPSVRPHPPAPSPKREGEPEACLKG